MTKRYLLAILLAAGMTTTISAQDDTTESIAAIRQELEQLKAQRRADSLNTATQARDERIWRKSAPWILMYGTQSIDDGTVRFKSGTSIGLAKRRTYFLHNKAIAGMVKFGLDVGWTELSVTRYAKGKGLSMKGLMSSAMGNVTDGNYATMDDYFDAASKSALDASDERDAEMDDILNRLDVGKFQISGGFAIGPSIHVVPFYALNKKGLDRIKVGAYFHYVPTFTALVFTGSDEDTSISGGYMGQWRYGVNLRYGRFGIGVEHQWGSGTLKRFNTESDDKDSDASPVGDKVHYNTSATRFYIGVKF